MLVLSRKPDDAIVIGSNIHLRVLSITGNTVRLGIDAPTEVPLRRAELPARLQPPPLLAECGENAKTAGLTWSEGPLLSAP